MSGSLFCGCVVILTLDLSWHPCIICTMKHFHLPCDRMRVTPEGENLWNAMMQSAKRCTMKHFLFNCDPAKLLDDEETFDDWWTAAKTEDTTTALYKSVLDDQVLYFIQTAGFEFIFRS
jgi:hypothetical protein